MSKVIDLSRETAAFLEQLIELIPGNIPAARAQSGSNCI
jgi:hypothetical protein